MDTSIQRLEGYIQKRRRRLITATRNNTNETRSSGTRQGPAERDKEQRNETRTSGTTQGPAERHKDQRNETKNSGTTQGPAERDKDQRNETSTRKQKWEEKQFYGRFKHLTKDISDEKTWAWLRKGNLMREIESLLIVAQNAIRTNHIKARIDKTQQNSRCELYDGRDETIKHRVSECDKLAQKEYKTRHDWVGKVIHWELCKKLKFDRMNKWYMLN